MSEGFQQAVDQQAAISNPPQEGSFGQAAPTSAPAAPLTLQDGSIVIDGRVYKAEAVATKIEHADKHIQTLEAENAQKDATTLKLLERLEALEANANRTDALDQLVQQQAQQPVVPATPEPAPTQEISKDELVEAAVDRIKAEQVQVQAEANLNSCIASAQEAFGDDFGSKVDAAGNQHGLTYDQVIDMAKHQPKVFKALLIPATAPHSSPDTTRSSFIGAIGQQGIGAPAARKSYLNMSAKQRNEEIKRRMDALSNPTG